MTSSPSTVTERTRLLPIASTVGAWDKLEGADDPRNWSPTRKWACVGVVSVCGLMSPVMGSAIVPALPEISRDLSIPNEGVAQLAVSLYVLGWSLGPLVIGPLSEVYGRALLLNWGQALFFLMSILSGLAQTRFQFLALRFIFGLVGSGPLSLGTGLLADLWTAEERGTSIALYTLGPLLGPAVGPIAGAYLTEAWSWRGTFFACAIVTFFTWIGIISFVHETFSPVLLRRKRARIAESDGVAPELLVKTLPPSLSKIMKRDLVRPFVLLGTQPIVQVLALYMAYIFGLNYLTIATFQALWRNEYGQSISRASLNYTSIALGFVLGSQITGRLNDKIYRTLKKRNNGQGSPEFRTVLMIPASLLVPLGEPLYGWSAQAKLHWIIPNIGVTIYSMGMIMCFQCITAYVLDCYPVYAASATGALAILRAIAGFVFPIFAPAMYASLGYGWASTLIAGFALVIGISSPLLLRKYGPGLRAKSQYASGDVNLDA